MDCCVHNLRAQLSSWTRGRELPRHAGGSARLLRAPGAPRHRTHTRAAAFLDNFFNVENYTVQKGDWISYLAVDRKITLKELAKLNRGVDLDHVVPGSVIRLPKKPAPPKAVPAAPTKPEPAAKSKANPAASIQHRVNKGDTVASLAARYSVSVDEIQAANPKLPQGKKLKAGTTIVIPSFYQEKPGFALPFDRHFFKKPTATVAVREPSAPGPVPRTTLAAGGLAAGGLALMLAALAVRAAALVARGRDLRDLIPSLATPRSLLLPPPETPAARALALDDSGELRISTSSAYGATLPEAASRAVASAMADLAVAPSLVFVSASAVRDDPEPEGVVAEAMGAVAARLPLGCRVIGVQSIPLHANAGAANPCLVAVMVFGATRHLVSMVEPIRLSGDEFEIWTGLARWDFGAIKALLYHANLDKAAEQVIVTRAGAVPVFGITGRHASDSAYVTGPRSQPLLLLTRAGVVPCVLVMGLLTTSARDGMALARQLSGWMYGSSSLVVHQFPVGRQLDDF
eukprot:jgi/Mesvir1/16287/Mv21732-RA.1